MLAKSSGLNLFDSMAKTSVTRNSSLSGSAKIHSLIIFASALLFGMIHPTASLGVPSSYAGTLSVSSSAFVRPEGIETSYYLYQALQFNVSVTGQYTFTSVSDIYGSLMGCLYHISFDPTNPEENLLVYNRDRNVDVHQTLFTTTLKTNEVYTLVITAFVGTAGDITATVDGPASIVLTPLPPVASIFNGTLSTSSANFTRPEGLSNDFYYQALHITNYKHGLYTFRSESTFRSYGLLYNGSVNPNDPQSHLVMSNYGYDGSDQFLIGYLLEANVEYTLIYTTRYHNVTGDFRIISTGPTPVTFVPYSPSPPFDLLNILGIGYNVFVGVVVLLSILTRKRQKK